ncbi:MAG: hypothetical protein HND52_06010 [Ignavibacteriae bacterium]|nr:hypothetical protein [Ignavibacteriota bacterium]NOG97499.1 hypothetical protein [Ignavibacteriota bacterium]
MKVIKKIERLNKTKGRIENPAIEFIIIPSEGGEEIFGIGKAEIKKPAVFYIKANFTEPEFEVGDTLDVIVKKVDEFGNESSFADSTDFEVGIVEGCDIGNILKPDGEEGQYFLSMKMPIKFIVADSLETDSTKVILRVGIESTDDTTYLPYSEFLQNNKMTEKANSQKTKSNKNDGASFAEDDITFQSCSIQDFMTDAIDTPEAELVEIIEIMLGETKYFGLQMKGEGTSAEYKICEVETEYGNAPVFPEDADGWIWQKTKTVWGDDPAEVVDEGGASGVYWEKKYPLFNGKSFKKMENLNDGLIRVIGRYWEEGKEANYKVKLTANDGAHYKTIIVKVVKPNDLLSDDESISYKWAKDIRNDDLNIDDFLIENGGKHGILPQLLKGQIFQEAIRENDKFWPSYRYEPWQDIRFRNQKNQDNVEYYLKQPYWVDANGMGLESGGEPVPIEHQNIRPILNYSTSTPYPNNPMKIGEYVSDNWAQYYVGSSSSLNRKFSKHPLYGPNEVQVIWNYLSKYYGKRDNKTDAIFQSEYFVKQFLKDNYIEFAQTRKASSYGYFQMLYTTAITGKFKYPRRLGNSPAPEKLSDHEIAKEYVMNHLLQNVNIKLRGKNESYSDNDWTDGFEKIWLESYRLYNGADDYAESIIRNSKKFSPKL